MTVRTSIEQLEVIKGYLRKNANYGAQSVDEIRQGLNDAAETMPQLEGIMMKSTLVGSIKGEWVRCERVPILNPDQVILYFHGGGFIAGTCKYYRDMAARISDASQVQVLTIEYRLSPEHPYPAANEDCLHAYRSLLSEGYLGENIILGGDSVGASLVLMTLLTLRDSGEQLPAGAFLLSPHSDLVHLDGNSYVSNAALDPTGSLEGNRRIAEAYFGHLDGEYPDILSPLRMDLHGLPPLLIQVGDQEVLLSDATRFADRAGKAGVSVSLEIWENMWSVFQFLAYMLPEAQQAIRSIGKFVKERLNH